MSETTQAKELLRQMYGGENKRLADGQYDKSLAVRCLNGTFVGRKTENIIAYRGIPYVGEQPVGGLRWKAPVSTRPFTMRRAPTGTGSWKQVPFMIWTRTACT